MSENDKSRSRGLEWRSGWTLVASAGAGMSLSPIVMYTMGLFIAPLEAEFGWSRTFITGGMMVNAVIGVALAAFVGALIDRIGPRRIAIPGAIIFCVSFAALSANNGLQALWWGLWLLIAIGNLLIKPTVWTAAVASRFVDARGLAIALVLCGSSFSGFLAPMVAGYTIETYGWRSAYLILGIGWMAVALPLIFLFFFGAADLLRTGAGTPAQSTATLKSGLGIREALLSGPFLKLAIGTPIAIFTLTAAIIHFVPMVSAGGLDRPSAIAIASVIGLASIAGRLTTGTLLDRFIGTRVGAVVFVIPLIAYLILLDFDGEIWLAVIVAFLLGFCAGAEFEVASYLSSRFFGLRNFGALFGLIVGLLGLATGLGPVVAGYVYDRFGSYEPALWGAIPLCLLASALIATLGPYPSTADGKEKPSA